MDYRLFAKGGLETAQWLTDPDAGYPVASQAENLCQAYIIYLGINDCARHDDDYIGTTADIHASDPDLNADTFTGNYAKIIQKLQALVEGAKVFVVTMPVVATTAVGSTNSYNDAIRAIAGLLDNVYLIDLYADYYLEFKRQLFRRQYRERPLYARGLSVHG